MFNLFNGIKQVECPGCEETIDADDYVCPECGARQICFDETNNQFYRIVKHRKALKLIVYPGGFMRIRGLVKNQSGMPIQTPRVDEIINPIERRLQDIRDGNRVRGRTLRRTFYSTLPRHKLERLAKNILDGVADPDDYPDVSVDNDDQIEKIWPFYGETNVFHKAPDFYEDLYQELIELQRHGRADMELSSTLNMIQKIHDHNSKPDKKKEKIGDERARQLGLYKSAPKGCYGHDD